MVKLTRIPVARIVIANLFANMIFVFKLVEWDNLFQFATFVRATTRLYAIVHAQNATIYVRDHRIDIT